jgi:hypothetical protein
MPALIQHKLPARQARKPATIAPTPEHHFTISAALRQKLLEFEQALAHETQNMLPAERAHLRHQLFAGTLPPESTNPNLAAMRQLDEQNAVARAAEFASGKLLTPAQLQQRLAVSRQAISKAVKEQRMFYLDGPSGENWYPAFFADATIARRALEQVCKALGSLPGASKWQFFTMPKVSLAGQTPLSALAAGELDAVLRAVTGFLER